MAKRGPVGLSISQLRSILAARQGDLKKLAKQRKGLLKQLAKIDARIARLDGAAVESGGAGAGRRPRNAISLVGAIEKVLNDKGRPMNISEVVAGVTAAGYRSSSPSFRAIVNQTLIKEKKKFVSTSRGFYQLKK